MLSVIALGFMVLAFAGFALQGVLLAATVYLIVLHRRLRPAALAREAAILARPLPADDALPAVVVQLPVFNEGALVVRGLAHAVALDWPADRLHIQLLDDSTELPDPALGPVIDEARALGIDVTILRRENRSEFKAGALKAGMAASPHGYFAILDADYVPEPDFLRQTMRGFLAEPDLAFVQARFDFLNGDENRLTQAQRILLDAHLAVEQATRSWAGHPLPFNGTCGIWRRDAIEAAGGWHGDTLAEDLDLSYRAWFRGRRGLFLTSVTVKGELPADIRVWASQQRRWTKGFGQVARRILPRLAGQAGLGWRDRAAAFLHLGAWWGPPIGVLTTMSAIAALVCDVAIWPWLMPPFILVSIGGIAVSFAFLRVGNRSLRGDALSLFVFTGLFGTIATLGLRLALLNARTYVETIRGRQTGFVRTPKRGAGM